MNLTGKRVFNMSTKVNERDSAATITTVTVILDGCSEEIIMSLAMRQLRVDLAQPMRAKGKIPALLTVELKNHGKRGVSSPPTPENALAQAMALSPEDFAVYMEKLKAMQK